MSNTPAETHEDAKNFMARQRKSQENLQRIAPEKSPETILLSGENRLEAILWNNSLEPIFSSSNEIAGNLDDFLREKFQRKVPAYWIPLLSVPSREWGLE